MVCGALVCAVPRYLSEGDWGQGSLQPRHSLRNDWKEGCRRRCYQNDEKRRDASTKATIVVVPLLLESADDLGCVKIAGIKLLRSEVTRGIGRHDKNDSTTLSVAIGMRTKGSEGSEGSEGRLQQVLRLVFVRFCELGHYLRAGPL